MEVYVLAFKGNIEWITKTDRQTVNGSKTEKGKIRKSEEERKEGEGTPHSRNNTEMGK